MAIILATSRNSAHSFSKQPQPRIRLIANEGVEHDAHCGPTVQHLYLKRRNAAAPNLCQVHLFASEMLDELASKGFHLDPGEIGENLLTQGIDLLSLPRGTQLHIGPDCVLEVTGLRTPCPQIDAFRTGLQQYLWGPPAYGSKKKSLRCGIMSVVLTGGLIHPDDTIRIILPATPHQPLGPV